VDPFLTPERAERIGVELVEMEALLAGSDFISVHIHLTPQTRGLIGEEAFAQMRPGVRIVNCARGGIVDEAALARALESGRVAGAALDVFAEEPPGEHPLLKDPRVIVTPHLGASTQEAQVTVALDVAEQILAVLAGRPPRTAVNMPAVSPEEYARLEPYLRLGDKMGRLHAQLAEGAVRAIEVVYSGDLVEMEVRPITRAILLGLMQPIMPGTINIVNAPIIAEERGICVTESRSGGDGERPRDLIVVNVESNGLRTVSGRVNGAGDSRIEAIDQFQVELVPEGYLLLCRHIDRPGIIGKIGTLLGDSGINIAQMRVGREAVRERALMVLSLDDTVPAPLLEEIRLAIEAESVTLVEL
jgi:D-3-phosphoglycerate dehydrogenase